MSPKKMWRGRGGGGGSPPAGWYASPSGDPGNAGTFVSPWDLQTALDGGPSNEVQPDDTIWMRGGTYWDYYVSTLTGTSGHPITVRAYPGERPIIDGNGSSPPQGKFLAIGGAYTRWWGLEVCDSDWVANFAADGIGPYAPSSEVVGTEIINCLIHDIGGNGIGHFDGAVDETSWGFSGGVVYGCIMYYNGGSQHTNGHAYAVYMANLGTSPDKVLENNYAGVNWGTYPFHAYTQGGDLDNIKWRKNCLVAGTGIFVGGTRNWILIGSGERVPNAFECTDNMLYGDVAQPFIEDSGNLIVGNDVNAADGATIQRNYIGCGAITLYTTNSTVGGADIDDTGNFNTFYGDVYGGWTWGTSGTYPYNTFGVVDTPPTEDWVMIHPNTYETGRGHLYIANWSGSSSHSFDLSSILSVNDDYEILDVLDLFGTPVKTGTYAGGSVSVPLAANPPVTAALKVPADRTAPIHTKPLYVFLVRKT